MRITLRLYEDRCNELRALSVQGQLGSTGDSQFFNRQLHPAEIVPTNSCLPRYMYTMIAIAIYPLFCGPFSKSLDDSSLRPFCFCSALKLGLQRVIGRIQIVKLF
jgi:hypothetical protein